MGRLSVPAAVLLALCGGGGGGGGSGRFFAPLLPHAAAFVATPALTPSTATAACTAAAATAVHQRDSLLLSVLNPRTPRVPAVGSAAVRVASTAGATKLSTLPSRLACRLACRLDHDGGDGGDGSGGDGSGGDGSGGGDPPRQSEEEATTAGEVTKSPRRSEEEATTAGEVTKSPRRSEAEATTAGEVTKSPRRSEAEATTAGEVTKSPRRSEEEATTAGEVTKSPRRSEEEATTAARSWRTNRRRRMARAAGEAAGRGTQDGPGLRVRPASTADSTETAGKEAAAELPQRDAASGASSPRPASSRPASPQPAPPAAPAAVAPAVMAPAAAPSLAFAPGAAREEVPAPPAAPEPLPTSTDRDLLHGFAFLAGFADVLSIRTFDCYATMLTGPLINLTMCLTSPGAFRPGDAAFFLSVILSFLTGHSTYHVLEQRQVRHRAAAAAAAAAAAEAAAAEAAECALDAPLADACMEVVSKEKSMPWVIAPLVLGLFVTADVLSLVAAALGAHQRAPALLVAAGYGLINGCSIGVTSTITCMLTGHLQKVATLGADLFMAWRRRGGGGEAAAEMRVSAAQKRLAFRGMRVIVSFAMGIAAGCAAWPLLGPHAGLAHSPALATSQGAGGAPFLPGLGPQGLGLHDDGLPLRIHSAPPFPHRILVDPLLHLVGSLLHLGRQTAGWGVLGAAYFGLLWNHGRHPPGSLAWAHPTQQERLGRGWSASAVFLAHTETRGSHDAGIHLPSQEVEGRPQEGLTLGAEPDNRAVAQAAGVVAGGGANGAETAVKPEKKSGLPSGSFPDGE